MIDNMNFLPLFDRIYRIAKKTPLSRLLFIEIVAGLVWNIGSLMFLVYLTKNVLEQDVLFLDRMMSNFVYQFRSPALTAVMQWITTVGNGPAGSFLAVLVIFLILKKHPKEAWLFSLSLLMVGALNYILKLIFRLPRPDIAPLVPVGGFTYPSGHAMNNLVLYGMLAFFSYRLTRSKKLSILLAILAAIWIGLIGFSRIYLGVHYPSDVAAGYLAGFWWLVTVLLVDKTLSLRKEIKEFRE